MLALHGTFAAQIALVAVWLGPKPLPRYARATCASLQFNTDATLVLVVDDKAIVPRECLDHARVWEVGADGVAKGLGEAAARALRTMTKRRPFASAWMRNRESEPLARHAPATVGSPSPLPASSRSASSCRCVASRSASARASAISEILQI